MQEIEFEYNPNLIAVHMSKAEIELLDHLQGGEKLLPVKTADGQISEIHDFSPLLDIFNDPAQREVFETLMAQAHKEKGKITKLSGIVEQKGEMQYQPTSADENPEIEQVADAGRSPDDEIALLPEGVADYFDQLMGGIDINPNTHLRQYFFFLAPLLGALLAPAAAGAAGITLGTLGTAAAMGLGAAAGSKLAGASWKQAGLHGLIGGAAGAFLPGIGGAMGGLGAKAAGALGGLGAAGGLWGAGAPAAAGTAAATGAAAGTGAIAAASPTIMSSLLQPGNLLPLAGMAGLLYKGHKDSQKLQRRHRQDTTKEYNDTRNRFGMNVTFGRVKPYKYIENPDYSDFGESTGQRRHFLNRPGDYEVDYARGGTVKSKGLANIPELPMTGKSRYIDGPGKGQDDRIPATIPEGAYIWDASSTSMLGDGSSRAGAKVIESYLQQLRNKSGKKGAVIEMHTQRTLKPVPAALSDGEYEISPAMVTIIGDGSNSRGAKILDEGRENLRAHKASGGPGLPPAAKSLVAYMPKISKIGR